MKGPYIQKKSWPAFAYQEQQYSLAHLDEYRFSMEDSRLKERRIVVTFGDHCFTRNCTLEDDPALTYPGSSRARGCFCVDRYRYSLGLRAHIERALNGKVWNAAGRDNYSIVPTVTRGGVKVLYSIVFSLEVVTGLPVDLHMRVRTAYLCDQKSPTTFGEVRFQHLVALRMQKKHPKRISDRNRRKPKLAWGQKE